MQQLKAIIVDDMQNDAEVLQDKVETFCPELRVVSKCKNIISAKSAISDFNPAIVFLDIKLGNQTGFDLIKDFDEKKPFEVIFVTGDLNNSDFLLNAIKNGGTYYLHKPVSTTELKKAVKKALDNYYSDSTIQRLQILMHNLSGATPQSQRILLSNNTDGESQIVIGNIVFCESRNNKVTFYLLDKSKIEVSSTLSRYEEMLRPYGFMRAQRSFLINLCHVASVRKNLRDVYMNGYPDLTVSFSRDKELWKEFLQWWERDVIR